MRRVIMMSLRYPVVTIPADHFRYYIYFHLDI